MAASTQSWFTPSEAAVVAGVSLRSVNRAIDESILPASSYRVSAAGARQISDDACVLLSFYFETAQSLAAEERLRVIGIAAGQLVRKQQGALKREWLIRQDFLTIDLSQFLKRVRKRLKRLREARGLVVEDPEVMGGAPVIRGTRVPVHAVAELAAAGEPIKRILEDFPRLTPDMVELAGIFAAAYPARGRPAQRPSLPTGAAVRAAYRVPLKGAATEKRAS